MIALFTTFLGILSSGLPHLLDFFKAAQDNSHELAMLEMQVRIAELEKEAKLQDYSTREYEASAKVYEAEQLRFSKERPVKTGIRFVDGFSAMVRPTIALWLCGYYSYVKYLTFKTFFMTNAILLPWQIEHLWGQEDFAILGAIIGFYFGGRTFDKLAGRK